MITSFILLLLLQPATGPGHDAPVDRDEPMAEAPADLSADAIAARVVQAAGGDVWPEVTRLKFTFNVEADGKTQLSARHDWDVRANTDTVTWGDKTVTVNLAAPGESEDAKAAFARWTNDSYWLIAPLKLQDGGVKFGPVMATRDFPPSRAQMTMRFDGVGLTPGDQYDLSIDLRNNRLTHWTYCPNATTSLGFSWDAYKDFNGLMLSTEHRSDDNARRIYFTDIDVQRK